MIRRWIIEAAGITAITLLATTLASAAPADAAITPCGNPGEYVAGGASSFQTSIFGAKADITFIQPSICGDHGSSVAWSMVTAHSSLQSGTDGWAQAGYGDFGSALGLSQSGQQEFSQQTLWCPATGPCASGYPVTKFHAIPSNPGPFDARNDYFSGCACVHMAYEGNVIDTTNFNPVSAWDAAWSAQFFGETHHLESDVPGFKTNHVHFTNLMKDTGGQSWANVNNLPNFGVTNSVCRYHAVMQSGTDFDIWTYPPFKYC